MLSKDPDPSHAIGIGKKWVFSTTFFLALLLCAVLVQAQSTFIPHDPDYYHLIDRFQIKFQIIATGI